MNVDKIRKEFPVIKNRIFFDHAKVAPLSARVRDEIRAFTEDATQFGTANYEKWMTDVENVRDSFARLINASSREVAFVKNTSDGISIVANGLEWQEGENVVIPDIEFPANVYPWLNLKRYGVETRFVTSVDGRVLFNDIAACVNDRTRIISVSSVECNSGFRNDLNRIGAFCKEKKILFCVDAIQSLGAIPMDVKKDYIDFLSADGHKWLMGVEGLGGFYISSKVLEKIHPAVVGWDSVIDANDYMNYNFTLRPDARRFEEGSFNVMSIRGLGAALSVFHEVGMNNVETRIMRLGDYILDRLQRRDINILNSTLPSERSGIISFSVQADLKKLATVMDENKISLTIRDNLVRLSPHFYNNEPEIDRFFEVFDKCLENC